MLRDRKGSAMSETPEQPTSPRRDGQLARVLIAAGGLLLLGYVLLSALSDVSAATRQGASDAYMARVYLSHILYAIVAIGAMVACYIFTRGLSD
jgi:hypothetical protein